MKDGYPLSGRQAASSRISEGETSNHERLVTLGNRSKKGDQVWNNGVVNSSKNPVAWLFVLLCSRRVFVSVNSIVGGTLPAGLCVDGNEIECHI